MATAKKVTTGSETKHPAKKQPKPTLKFTHGEDISPSKVKESAGIDETAVETITQKEEIVDVKSTLPVEGTTVNNADKSMTERAIERGNEIHNNVEKLINGGTMEVDLSPKPLPTKAPQPFKSSNKHLNKTSTPHPSNKEILPAPGTYPAHIQELALLVKNNSEIRRFTSLGILNYLMQKGIIKGKGKYVSFKWDKFVVKADRLVKEYAYTEPFFLNALVASFTSFSASAQKTINIFTEKELDLYIGEAVDMAEVESIAASINH